MEPNGRRQQAEDSETRYQLFVDRVPETGKVWGLKSADGWCQSSSAMDGAATDRAVMPFWSDRAQAAACAHGEWDAFRPTAIPLADFAEAWLPGMAADGVLVGVNWNADLIGGEVEPAQLAEDLGLDPADCLDAAAPPE